MSYRRFDLEKCLGRRIVSCARIIVPCKKVYVSRAVLMSRYKFLRQVRDVNLLFAGLIQCLERLAGGRLT